MAVSKPILFALIAAIVALGAFYATSGGREAATDSSEPAGPTAERRPAPAKPAPQRKAKAA